MDTKYLPVGFLRIVAERIFPYTSLAFGKLDPSQFRKLYLVSIYFDRWLSIFGIVTLTGVGMDRLLFTLEAWTIILFFEKAFECIVQMFQGIL
jgi:hypothetical protein